jgi:hypothetical protein
MRIYQLQLTEEEYTVVKKLFDCNDVMLETLGINTEDGDFDLAYQGVLDAEIIEVGEGIKCQSLKNISE